jgi:hypothetical protein
MAYCGAPIGPARAWASGEAYMVDQRERAEWFT